MRKKKIEKPVKTVLIILLIICIVVPLISSLISNFIRNSNQGGELSQTQEEEQETPGEGTTDGDTDTAQGGSQSSGNQDNSGSTETETSEEEMVFGFDTESTAIQTGSIQIGNITVEYLTEDATAGEGSINQETMNSILFHDGTEGDLKGYMFAVSVDMSGVTIDTVEEAQDSVGEYIPDGSGIAYAWEETGNAFIRKTEGYDNAAEGAYLFYTIVPKDGTWDDNLYSIVVTAYEGDNIKKSSYESMLQPVQDYIPDSALLSLGYEDACAELEEVLKNKTATGTSMGGLDELQEAHSQWLYDVYGVESEEELDALSEEEKADRLWRYRDPVGYLQAHDIDPAEEGLETEAADENKTSETEQAEERETVKDGSVTQEE